jgi:hypothetical protein
VQRLYLEQQQPVQSQLVSEHSTSEGRDQSCVSPTTAWRASMAAS